MPASRASRDGRIIVASFVLATLATACVSSAQATTGPEAKKLVKNGALLVDVRSPGEFAEGHIEGAINIPHDQVGSRLGEFGAREKPIVLYCRSGRRSGGATEVLKKAGFTAVHDLGAMANWTNNSK